MRIVFLDSAPAPLKAIPAAPPKPAAREAATDMASIVASVVADREMSPVVVLKDLSVLLSVLLFALLI